MANPIIFLLGYKSLVAPICFAADILNAARRYGIVYRNQKSNGEYIYLECSLWSARRLIVVCERQGIVFSSIKEHGFPRILTKYRHRYGIFIGIIISIFLLVLSSTVVWDIRIDGEKRLTEKQVLSILDECGICVGSRLSSLDTDVIQNRVIIYSDDISWISINLSGTVAQVEIRESEPRPDTSEEPLAANLVATDDAVICGLEEVRGEIAVKIGDRVNRGDLLVSGIRDSTLKGFSYKAAKGKVLGKVTTDYFVEIPLEYQEKSYQSKVFVEKYIIFFNKMIKIYANNRNLATSCDIIDTVEYADIFSMGELPFGMRTVRYLPYDTVLAKRSAEEAIELALYKLRCLEEELMISDVFSKQLSGDFLDGVYRLDCKSVYLKNIAKQVEVEIVP